MKDAIDGNLGDVELATFLLSEYFYGMDGEELESLVRAMVDTGSVIEFEETVYDEHSIGGVPGNSKVALIAVPTVAYAGLLIPKTSSRAITSPAGTADTMEVLARVDFTPEEIKEIALKTKGLIAWGGALNMAPADDIFIRVLQRIMLDPYMQMVASILSKKLAMNVSNLVVDIPVGRGAKVTSMETAMKIANLFVYQGVRLGIKVKCAISYGGQPVGYSIGPALEAKEALETLMGKGPMSVLEKAAGIAGILFEVAGVVPRGKGAYLAKDLIKSGKSLEKMREIIEAQGGKIGDLSVYGQESNQTTWRLCKMNMAIRGIDANIRWGDSFHDDQFKDLRADFIIANPPFNDSDWGGEILQDDVRWKFGVPPKNNANFAWVQHFIHHVSPTGTAGFVLANGSMSSNTSNEGEIRKNIILADMVDCMVALPSQLFYNTSIPACLWFVTRDKKDNKFRDRREEILFIDARNMGRMIDRRHRELTDEDIKKIAETYHSWRGENDIEYKDVLGFCKAAKLEEVEKHNFILTPGRYVGIPEEEEDDEEFEEKMKRLASELAKQMKEGKKLDEEIRENLERIGLGV